MRQQSIRYFLVVKLVTWELLAGLDYPRHTRRVATRLSSAETRERLLQAGLEVLTERGSSIDPLVELADVIAAAGVPRSSAYRAFKHETMSAQQAFSLELSKLLVSSDVSNVDATVDRAFEILAESPDLLDNGTPAELAQVLRELIRQCSEANLSGLDRPRMVWLYLGTMIAVGQAAGTENPLAETLQPQNRADSFTDFYRQMVVSFGLRLRQGWTFEHLDAAISAIMMGAGARMVVDTHLEGLKRPTGPNGEMQPWTTAAVLIESLVVGATEANPRVRNAADLSTWQ